MPSVLYGHPQSPFCRSVHVLLELLDVKHEYKFVDLAAGEQNRPEYMKVNKQHNVPYYIDAKTGLELNESRAILIFLAQKYDKSKKYFSDDIETQARINQKLYFDATVLWPAFRDIIVPLAFQRKKKDEVPEDRFARLKEVLGWLNEFVTPTGYLAGTDHMTVADIAAYSVYAHGKVTQKSLVDFDEYPEANKWEASIREQIKNYDKVMGEGLKIFDAFFRTRTGLI